MPTCVLALVVCACAWRPARAFAAPCTEATVAPTQTDPIAVHAEGRAYAEKGRYPEARAMYLWLLTVDPTDREARLALARLDAWDGCWKRAQDRYVQLLKEAPRDVEARAGLIDVLLWSDRWAEARAAIDLGLELDPKAPELWQRRARLMQWTGERALAIEAADRAEALAPGDTEIRLLRDRLFVSQARASLRTDVFFPRDYPDLYTADLQALQHWHQLELAVDAQVRDRSGGTETHPVIDGLYTASALYHAAAGSTLGLSLGFGAPAVSVPALQTRAWFLAQLGSRWSPSMAYAFWQYRSDKTLHIFAPAIGYAVNDDIQLELHWWSSYLVLPRPGASPLGRLVHAAGARATWRALAPLTLGTGYTYGPQLDQAPAKYDFLLLTSHVFSLFADWLVQRGWGLQPMVGFERRRSQNGAVAFVFSSEVASYLRW